MLKSGKENKQYYKEKRILEFKKGELYKSSLELFGKNELTNDKMMIIISMFFIFLTTFMYIFSFIINAIFFVSSLSAILIFLGLIIIEFSILRKNRDYLLQIISKIGFRNNIENDESLKKLDELKYVFLAAGLFLFSISLITFFILR